LNPATLYAGTSGGGIFKTTSSGANWSAINSGLFGLTVQAIAVDPTSSSTVYAGTTNGVFKSNDGGANWLPSSLGMANLSIFAVAVAIDPTSHTTLYAGTTGGGTYKSVDAGATWQPTGTTLVPFPTPASITVTAGSGQSTTINTTFGAALQATVRNSGNNPVTGAPVTFTAPSSGASGTFANGSVTVTVMTNASGVATAPAFTANSTAGTYDVTATVAPLATPVHFALTNSNLVAGSITPAAGTTPQSVTVGTPLAVALQATVRDGTGGAIPGVLVTFTAPASGPSGTFAGAANTVSVTSNAAGIVAAPAFTANTIAGNYIVTASAGSVTANFDVTNTPAAASHVAPAAGTPQGAPTSTSFASALQALVRDQFSNPVANITVTFTAPSSGPSASFAGATSVNVSTNASGIAAAPPLTANGIAGAYTIRATIAGSASVAVYSLSK
jgi:hypothetical protein